MVVAWSPARRRKRIDRLLRYRAKGLTFAQIGEKLGISKSFANSLWHQEQRRLAREAEIPNRRNKNLEMALLGGQLNQLQDLRREHGDQLFERAVAAIEARGNRFDGPFQVQLDHDGDIYSYAFVKADLGS
jgi:transcriptional regulator with XRE-family HTH domain